MKYTRTAVALTAMLFLLTVNAASAQWKRHTIDDASRGADGVRLGDVNRDGLPDIVTPWEQGGVIRVCLNPGPKKAKEKWPAVTVGKVGGPEDAVFVDLDGDGMLDVVSSCEGGTRSVFVHWAPKDVKDVSDPAAWKTQAFPAVAKLQLWMFALPMDIDGKHGVDLVIGSKGKNATVGWLEAPKNPRNMLAWKYHKLRDAGWIMSLASRDINGDGNPDILLSDRKGKRTGTFWLENPGAAATRDGKPWREHAIGAEGLEVMFLAVSDIDGDGRDDVLSTTRNKRLVLSQRLGDKSDVRWKSHRIYLPLGMPFGKSIAVGHINGDKKLDIVTTNRGKSSGSSVAWMEYKDSPSEQSWTAHDISGPEGSKFDLIELVDMDADGDLDVLTCEEVANLGVFWYENPLR